MPPRKETAFQKAERKRLESQRELNRGQVQAINRHMKEHPQLVPCLYEALQRAMRECGLQTAESDSGTGHPATSRPMMLALPAPSDSSAPDAHTGPGSRASESSAGDGGAAGSSEAGSSSYHTGAAMHSRSYRSLESSSVVFLQELLSAIEPVVFAKHAIGIVTRHGARLQNVKALCELIELCTGMAGAEQIVVGEDQAVTAVLKLRLSELNIAFGRRGLETPLPPDWMANGVYRIILDGSSDPKIQNRFTQVIKAIRAPELKRVDKKLICIHDIFPSGGPPSRRKGPS